MIKKQFYLLFALLISSYFMYGQLTPIPDGRRLREIIADKYKDGNLLIGGTTGQWAFGTATGEILDREFSYVTPENDFKQRQIHPDNTDKWNWSQADSWIGHIATNGQTLRMHGPISPQCSNWVKDDARTAAELEKNMRDFMEALCQRYNGTLGFEYMDVVNETVINGAWHKNKSGFGWEVPWFIIGQNSDENKTPLYIRYAFEIASEYVTDTKLIYNHHERTIINLSWNLVKKTILYLRGLGLRVDGIGWQAHINAGWEQIKGQTDALRDIIDWAHQNNLEFHITENSVFLNGNTPSDYEKQADTYKALFDILIEKSNNGEIGWNTWHIDEGHGSKTENYPAIFDKNYKAKPAYYAIQLALEAEGDYTTPYEVGFQVINTESGFPIKDCSVIINDDTVRTNSAGLAVFQNVTAGIYNARAEKKYYNPTSANGFSVYSDTLFSMELDSAEIIYDVAFHVEDKQTGNSIVHAKVEIDSIIKTTDFSGNVAYSLKPGNYQVRISENDYKSLEVDVTIQSDTLLTFRLEKLFAEIKFRLKNQGVPVNKALVVLNNDSLFTSSLGIATFRSLPVDSTYSYKINKDNYQTLQGSLILTTDITLNLEIEKMSTGINELKKVDFHFYPNPAGNYLNIESENGLGKLELLKSNGSVIRSFKALSTLKTISLSNFPNGFYFIRRYGGDDMLPEVKSLIIRR